MTTSIRSLLVAATLFISVTSAAAQTPMVPTAIKAPDGEEKITIVYSKPTNETLTESGEHPVAALTRVYKTGNGQQLNKLAIEILSTISCNATFFALPTGKPCGPDKNRKQFDLERDYVLLTWVGLDYSGKRVIHRIGVHDERDPDPYNVTLPGLGRSQTFEAKASLKPETHLVYEMFLSVTPDADHMSLYVFTAQPDPVQAQIPAFVQAASGAMFASASKLFGTVNKSMMSSMAFSAMGGEPGPPPNEPIRLTAKLSTLRPPLKRSKVKITDITVQPLPLFDFQRQVGDLADKLRFVDVRASKCASSYVTLLAPPLVATARSANCTDSASTPATCRSALGATIEVTLKGEDKKCADALNGDELKAERSAMQQVDTEFRKLIAAQQPERLTGDAALSNTPLTHIGFGILTGFAFYEKLYAPRVKVGNDGKLAADPLSRQLTAFVVNIAPTGYPADAPSMSWAERVRGFVGVTATPEFGLTSGISGQIWRGVGIDFGGATMFVPTFGDSKDQIGQAPSDPTAPFSATRATTVFLGLHYNFK